MEFTKVKRMDRQPSVAQCAQRNTDTMTTNPNCDGGHCLRATGEVRVLPVGGEGNAILCRTCFYREIAFRKERNLELSPDCRFDLPAWDTLKVYAP